MQIYLIFHLMWFPTSFNFTITGTQFAKQTIINTYNKYKQNPLPHTSFCFSIQILHILGSYKFNGTLTTVQPFI